MPISPLNYTGLKIDQLSQRHQVLAGNIANAQTPGYKSKDIQFEDVLNQTNDLNLNQTNQKHFGLEEKTETQGLTLDKESNRQASLDGNTVDLDEERAELAKNALNLEAQMRFATHYLRLSQIAAS